MPFKLSRHLPAAPSQGRYQHQAGQEAWSCWDHPTTAAPPPFPSCDSAAGGESATQAASGLPRSIEMLFSVKSSKAGGKERQPASLSLRGTRGHLFPSCKQGFYGKRRDPNCCLRTREIHIKTPGESQNTILRGKDSNRTGPYSETCWCGADITLRSA